MIWIEVRPSATAENSDLGQNVTVLLRTRCTRELPVPANRTEVPPAVASGFVEAHCKSSLMLLQLLLIFSGCDQAPLRGLQSEA